MEKAKNKFTANEIRAAISRAADRIEREGARHYSFYQVVTPKCGNGTACMLGWIGFELGMKPEHYPNVYVSDVSEVLGYEHGEFYTLLNKSAPDDAKDYQTSYLSAAAALHWLAKSWRHPSRRPKS